MAPTNAGKQARYRQRHLDVDGEKARVQLVVSAATRAQLDRLARHRGYTVTAPSRNWPQVRSGAPLLRSRRKRLRHTTTAVRQRDRA
jgi:hypothetical protein